MRLRGWDYDRRHAGESIWLRMALFLLNKVIKWFKMEPLVETIRSISVFIPSDTQERKLGAALRDFSCDSVAIWIQKKKTISRHLNTTEPRETWLNSRWPNKFVRLIRLKMAEERLEIACLPHSWDRWLNELGKRCVRSGARDGRFNNLSRLAGLINFVIIAGAH